jgi:hypothetical protein
VDLRQSADGIALRDDDDRIYVTLFVRTLVMSLIITAPASCWATP